MKKVQPMIASPKVSKTATQSKPAAGKKAPVILGKKKKKAGVK